MVAYPLFPLCAGAGALLNFLLLAGCLSHSAVLSGFVSSTSWLGAQVGHGSRQLHCWCISTCLVCICLGSFRLRVLLRSKVGLSDSVVVSFAKCRWHCTSIDYGGCKSGRVSKHIPGILNNLVLFVNEASTDFSIKMKTQAKYIASFYDA